MNETLNNQFQEFFNITKDVRIPENIQAMAEDSLAKSREAYQRINIAAQEQFKAAEQLFLATHAGTKAICDKMTHNTVANTEAMFNAAQSVARAKTVPEATRLQADYLQQQTSTAAAQAKEIFDLSAKVTKQTLEAINTAAAKSFENTRKPE